jgi:hypothetical protein
MCFVAFVFDIVSKIIEMQGRMSDVKWKFQRFENVLSNLLTKLVFHIEKGMNTVSFVDGKTTDKFYLLISVTTSSCVTITESHRDLIQGVGNKKRDIHRYTRCHELWKKTPV